MKQSEPSSSLTGVRDIEQDSASGHSFFLNLSDRRIFLITGDFICSLLAAFMSILFWNLIAIGDFSAEWFISRMYWIPIMSVGWTMTGLVTGLYSRMDIRETAKSILPLVRTAGYFNLAYVSIYFLSPRQLLPRLSILMFSVLVLGVVIGWRKGWLQIVSQDDMKRKLLFLGMNDITEEITRISLKNRGAVFHPVGFISGKHQKSTPGAESNPKSNGPDQVPELGTIENFSHQVKNQNVTDIVLTGEVNGDYPEATGELLDCHKNGVAIIPAVQLFERLTNRVPVSYIKENWDTVLPLSDQCNNTVFPAVKRMVDIAGAILGLSCFLLMFPFLALAIKLDSDGPIFYRQERMGLGGERFELLKLRTMVENAEEEGNPQWAKENDDRITTVGRFLRKTHLDEFPQFWNVLKGDMSLVGPRPERPEFERELEERIPYYQIRHAMKPGITSWATIHNNYVSDLESAKRRVEYDVYYKRYQSLWLDTQIIFRTVWELVSFGGR